VLTFLIRHGYLLLGGLVLAEQLGLPLPAIPVLLAMGSLTQQDRFSFLTALTVGVLSAVAADSVWYILGARRGHSVLKLLCRISLEPDSCVSNTKRLFARLGWPSLLFCKFIPGFSTAAPPLAAITGMGPVQFLAADLAGSALWVGAFLGLGALFHREIEWLTEVVLRTGSMAGVTLGGGLALWIVWKIWQRRRFLRALRMARVEPVQVWEWMEAGEPLVVVDLRHTLEVETEGAMIPGALRISPDEMETRHGEIPRDREIVVYCS
jgi:membrane protein DedA with SNARE-associated domain